MEAEEAQSDSLAGRVGIGGGGAAPTGPETPRHRDNIFGSRCLGASVARGRDEDNGETLITDVRIDA